MRESGVTSPKPEIVEQINGNEVDLSDPYKQTKGEFIKSQSIYVSQKSTSEPYSDALPIIVQPDQP